MKYNNLLKQQLNFTTITMKYTLGFAVLALLTIGIASCNNETTTSDMESVPGTVQQVVTENFSAPVVSVTTEDAALGVSEYEIYLNDGTKVSFAGEEWDEVEMPAGQAVPATFVIAPISEYVTATYPGQNIVKIEKDRKGYEIKLANGVEIDFDVNGNFIKVD